MVKTITPFSTRAKEGATDSPLGDFVNVDQSIVSTADVGFYDENTGKLTGVRASDTSFIPGTIAPGIANGGVVLTPSVNADGTWPLNMTGFCDLIIAIKPTNGGNCAIAGVMGPDSNSFGGLSPVNAAAILRGVRGDDEGSGPMFYVPSETLVADVWNIYIIQNTLKDQKLLQISITNNSGGSSDIETAFMRIV